MRGIKRSAALLLAFGTAFALTPMAGAQEPVKPVFSLLWDSHPGAAFAVSIKADTCPGGPVSLTSPGFASFNLGSLSGQVVTTPGTYTATLKCKDTTEVGTTDFTIVPPRSDSFLDKAVYAPGETIRISLKDGYKCWVPATSEGFTAPANLTQVHGDGDRVVGETTAITTPGTYTATIPCLKGGPVVNQFTIKASATPPPPGTPAPKQKPPIIKPKGAPQTGGGGTA